MKTTLGRFYTKNWERGQNYAHCHITRYREDKGWLTHLYKHISHASFFRINTIDAPALEGDTRRVHLIIH